MTIGRLDLTWIGNAIVAKAGLVVALAAVPTIEPALAGSPWSRFRGPNGSGVSNATGLPATIAPDGNLVWKTDVPSGYSSPVIAGDHVVLTAAEGTSLWTLCLNRHTGVEAWRAEAPEPLERPARGPNSPVAPTPATDGENTYVFFESFGLVSYDARGAVRWSVRLGPFNNPYGMGTSPILAGDTLLLQADQDKDSFLLALDKDTGKTRWRTARPGATHGFSSPIVHTPDDGPPQVVVSGSYRVTGYDLATGERLWWITGMAWQAKSLPVIHDDMLFVHSWMASPAELGVKKITTPWSEALATWDADEDERFAKSEISEALGLERLWFLFDLDDDDAIDEEEWSYVLARATAKNGLYGIRLDEGRGDLTESHVLWRYKRSLPNIPSPLYYDGILYILKEGGILTALDPVDGSAIKSARVEGAEDPYFASPVAAAGRLITASHAGRVAIIRAGRDWEVLSVGDFEQEIWATPALVDGQVIVRTQEALYCFGTE